jgi:DUF971 family protein
MPNPATDPQHIAISKSKGVKIDWKDSHSSEYGLQYLRDHCPCATCTGAHGTPPRPKTGESPFQLYQPKITILDVHQAGNYALQINWSDGHSSGIYSYEHLRMICPCENCRDERDGSGA